jgi:hypothetical protein
MWPGLALLAAIMALISAREARASNLIPIRALSGRALPVIIVSSVFEVDQIVFPGAVIDAAISPSMSHTELVPIIQVPIDIESSLGVENGLSLGHRYLEPAISFYEIVRHEKGLNISRSWFADVFGFDGRRFLRIVDSRSQYHIGNARGGAAEILDLNNGGKLEIIREVPSDPWWQMGHFNIGALRGAEMLPAALARSPKGPSEQGDNQCTKGGKKPFVSIANPNGPKEYGVPEMILGAIFWVIVIIGSANVIFGGESQ